MLEELPEFPVFTQLSLHLKEPVESFVHKFGANADYNFVSLWCYNVLDSIIISRLNGNLVVRFSDYVTSEPLFSFLGTNDVRKTVDTLFAYEKSKGLKVELKLIPEIIVDSANLREHYAVLEDRDNFDYILSVDEIRSLEGKRFHTHRNHINTFKRLYEEYNVEVHKSITEDVKKAITSIFATWVKYKGDKAEGHEEIAFSRLFDLLESSRLVIIILKHKHKPVAFSISDLHHQQVCQIHFAKADPAVRQAYYVINQVLAEELSKTGHTKINLENDLGIPGLRYAKEQWNPIEFVKKYTLTPKI